MAVAGTSIKPEASARRRGFRIWGVSTNGRKRGARRGVILGKRRTRPSPETAMVDSSSA